MIQVPLVATDLDGTLLRNDGTLSARTRAAIRAAQAAGIKVVFVTARPPRHVRALAHEAGVTGLSVCANGAIIYDAGSDEVLHAERLEKAVARELIDLLRSEHPEIAFAAEHGHRLSYEPGFPQIVEDLVFGEPHVAQAHRLCEAEELSKLLVHHPEHRGEALAQLMRVSVSGRAEVLHSGGDGFIELAAAGVSKASGLRWLCRELQVEPERILAFGDMPNDIPMLALAGRAVAVANAHPDVIAMAHEVTASNEDDGVARTIEALLA